MLAAVSALMILACRPAQAELRPGQFPELAFEQHLGAKLPLDAKLQDESGRTVLLSDFFDGKPVVVALEYLRCPNLCGLVLGGLFDAIAESSLKPGLDYRVVAISIDPRETSADALAAKRDYLARYEDWQEAAGGLHFLTGSAEEVQRVADAIGFSYRYDKDLGQYAHPAGVTVTTPAGIVSSYLFGVSFRPLDLRLALTDASSGSIGSPVSRLLLLCYGYDPAAGVYSFAVMPLVRGASLITVLIGGVLLIGALRRERRA